MIKINKENQLEKVKVRIKMWDRVKVKAKKIVKKITKRQRKETTNNNHKINNTLLMIVIQKMKILKNK